ncbi:MAG TPA: CoA pyrophosphatase [Usitatibacter sp.]|jgi:8-oxo-dGTP pyrophosphatase MutT (NUDIX family)|nr:CoA pyrophosphatase [Usitatibacter sp.]
MSRSISVQGTFTMPTRAQIVSRLAASPPIEELLTADDLERQASIAEGDCRAAAVLILVVNHPGDPTVVFTQRTAHLADHAGQISFPGGRADEGDPSRRHTALREAEEEIGVAPERVEVLGELPEYHTGTGYRVTPIVGWAEPPLEFHPDPHEVADVFEVPLAFLLDEANHRYESAFFKGRMRKFWSIPFGERFIWGATAGMLVTFHRIVRPKA